MGSRERRCSDRVSLFNAIRVNGKDGAGEPFSLEARTALVTQHGAAIIVNRELSPNTALIIRCYGTNTDAEARVVGKIEKHREGFLYGVQFVDPGMNPWNIRFPTAGPAPEVVGRLLLQCSACERRELVYLDELEVEVFAANHCLTRTCAACAKATEWKATPHEVTVAEGEAANTTEGEETDISVLVPRTRNDRKFLRLRTKLRACIRHPELGDDVVECGDVSRGGVCFLSRKHYTWGTRVEAAVPYLQGQANIFTRAKIANVRVNADSKGLNSYGVSYTP